MTGTYRQCAVDFFWFGLVFHSPCLRLCLKSVKKSAQRYRGINDNDEQIQLVETGTSLTVLRPLHYVVHDGRGDSPKSIHVEKLY